MLSSLVAVAVDIMSAAVAEQAHISLELLP
jgi:hypothetical protein